MVCFCLLLLVGHYQVFKLLSGRDFVEFHDIFMGNECFKLDPLCGFVAFHDVVGN